MPAYADDSCLLAGGAEGPTALRPLTSTVLDALREGAATRCGPLPRGGPQRVAAEVRTVLGSAPGGGASGGAVIPEHGTGSREALRSLVRLVAQGAADPADPLCAAHLHCPPLAVAVAADLAAAALNPSMDSWDQAPAASELEGRTCRALAELVYGGGRDDGCDDRCGDAGDGARVPDALVTTGGTESNQLGVLLAREEYGSRVRVVCGANAHHSVHRAAWLLGLPEPLVVPTPRGVLAPGALREALDALRTERTDPAAGPAPVLVVATAGTTDTGAIDPLAELADVVRQYGAREPHGSRAARLHVDAAYGGPLLFSHRLRSRLAGLERADSVSLDLHKLGWQPVAAGLFAVPDRHALSPLDHRADYLNADDDTEAGLPDLLGRSLRTTRRPDVLKMAVTLRALGRSGLASLVERTCEVAQGFAELVAADPRFELYGRPELSTVLFRPTGADGAAVAEIRRRLLADGRAVLGRADVGCGAPGGGTGSVRPGGSGRDLWLKATLLNPHAQHSDLAGLLKLVHDAAPEHVPEPASVPATSAARSRRS